MDIGIGSSQVISPPRATSTPVLPFAGQSKATSGEGEVKPALSAASAAHKDAGEPVEQAVSSIQNFVQSIRRDLNFSLDDSSGRVVVKVTDSASGEVIRQLPSEEALRLAESLEGVRSLLFKAEA